jgi:hypothetical protein
MAGRAKDPDLSNKEISDVFHRFLSQVYLTVGQTQGKTLLPLPPRDLNQKEVCVCVCVFSAQFSQTGTNIIA